MYYEVLRSTWYLFGFSFCPPAFFFSLWLELVNCDTWNTALVYVTLLCFRDPLKAMGIGALPQNAGATATALAVLCDELAFLSGDRSTDLAWYGKRGLIAGIYASTGRAYSTPNSAPD